MSSIATIDRFVRYALTPHITLGFEGLHGVGKTSYAKFTMPLLLAERFKVDPSRVHVIDKCASQLEPADLIGGFREHMGRTYNCPPIWIPVAKSYDDEMISIFGADKYKPVTNYDDYYILFIDEWRRGTPQIANALMELTSSQRIFGVPLHEKCFVVVADNDDLSIYNGNTSIDPAQIDRVKNFQYAPTDEEFLSIYKQRVSEDWIHPAVLEYLLTYRADIVAPRETIRACALKHEKTVSPRAWEELGHSLNTARHNGYDYVEEAAARVENADELEEVARSHIGDRGSAFSLFCQDRKGMTVDINAVLYGGGSASSETTRKQLLERVKEMKPLSFPVFAYNLSRTLAEKKLPRPEYGRNLLELMGCLPDEAITACWTDWSNADATTAMNWMNYSGARMNMIYKTYGGYKSWSATQKAKGIDLTSDEPIIKAA